MSRILCVLLCVCWAITAAQRGIQTLNLYEGAICKEENGSQWTCKHHSRCPTLRESLKKGKRPPVCSFVAPKNPVICCEPEVAVRPLRPVTGASKSTEMCKKYGKSVYRQFPKPLGDGYLTQNLCLADIEPLIVEGTNAEAKEYPHMALVGLGRKENIDWACGGSLISERFVVSAAHCTITRKGLPRWVRLGEYNKDSMDDDKRGQANPIDYEIVQNVIHPNYKKPSVYNDIVLFKLDRNVEFNEFIRPICLQLDRQFSKTYAIATGWGRTEYGGSSSSILQKVNLTISSKKECRDAFKEAEGKELIDGINDETMMCAGDGNSGKDTCQGDSGGPLQLRLREPYCMYSLLGITSFGARCGEGKPGVYTRVSHFVPWIESVVWP